MGCLPYLTEGSLRRLRRIPTIVYATPQGQPKPEDRGERLDVEDCYLDNGGKA